MDFRVFSRNISENMHARCVREDTKQALKENLQADGVQSRQTLFVRYCLIHFSFSVVKYIIKRTLCFLQNALHDVYRMTASLRHQLYHNCLLCVQAVLCLLKDLVGMCLEYLCGDFFFAVCRQAVLYLQKCSQKMRKMENDRRFL